MIFINDDDGSTRSTSSTSRTPWAGQFTRYLITGSHFVTWRRKSLGLCFK